MNHASFREIEIFCNELLTPEDFDDSCFNGIQIETNEPIRKILVAVTISDQIVDQAIDNKVQAILVHHGFFGKDLFSLRGQRHKLVTKMLENKIGLSAYHLPLDAHPEVGNNVALADILELENREKFYVGLIGQLPKVKTAKEVGEKLKEDSFQYLFISNPDRKINKVCVLTGVGGYYAMDQKLFYDGSQFDLFITGDINEYPALLGDEIGFSFMALGHDNSEKLGVARLARVISEKFGVDYIEGENKLEFISNKFEL